jgi:uncharacterized protein (DUF1330 family)
MAAYLIVEIQVRDPEGYEEYRKLASDTVRAHGGRYLVRGGAVEVLEGEWDPRRVVILEFPTLARAKEWWSSPEYQKAREIRIRAAGARMLLVEGM